MTIRFWKPEEDEGLCGKDRRWASRQPAYCRRPDALGEVARGTGRRRGVLPGNLARDAPDVVGRLSPCPGFVLPPPL
ncbi:hypothetical protein CRG98_042116 [Punica granatum]|uniref:Uncharacterized protein n=1 Tax=Punica granatum TaxID=22663 RepID=A0A2I0I0J4_PUNGR|nr:hypothetical protein CRG98_042116 [Punica granatum]